jgi:hypothetical protein
MYNGQVSSLTFDLRSEGKNPLDTWRTFSTHIKEHRESLQEKNVLENQPGDL